MIFISILESERTALKEGLLCHKGRFVEVRWKYDRWKEKFLVKRNLSLKGTGEMHL